MILFYLWATNTGHDCSTVFTNSILATHMGGLLAGLDPQFEKLWPRGFSRSVILPALQYASSHCAMLAPSHMSYDNWYLKGFLSEGFFNKSWTSMYPVVEFGAYEIVGPPTMWHLACSSLPIIYDGLESVCWFFLSICYYMEFLVLLLSLSVVCVRAAVTKLWVATQKWVLKLFVKWVAIVFLEILIFSSYFGKF